MIVRVAATAIGVRVAMAAVAIGARVAKAAAVAVIEIGVRAVTVAAAVALIEIGARAVKAAAIVVLVVRAEIVARVVKAAMRTAPPPSSPRRSFRGMTIKRHCERSAAIHPLEMDCRLR